MNSLYAWGAVIVIVLALVWVAARAWRRLGETEAKAVHAKRSADQAKRKKELDEHARRVDDDTLDRGL